jgi:hypothetical protein
MLWMRTQQHKKGKRCHGLMQLAYQLRNACRLPLPPPPLLQGTMMMREGASAYARGCTLRCTYNGFLVWVSNLC